MTGQRVRLGGVLSWTLLTISGGATALLSACGLLPGQTASLRVRRLLLPGAFLALAGPLGAALALLTPVGQVADEPAHVFRMQALLRGQLAGERQMAGARLVAGVDADPATLAASFLRRDVMVPLRGITPAELDAKRAVEWTGTYPFMEITPLAVYAPVFYVPGAIGLGVAKLSGARPYQAVLAGRIVTLLAYLALGSAALLAARRGRATLFCLLSVPTAVSLGASCSQDGLIIAAAALGVALLTRPPRPRDAPFWAGAGLLACVALVKVPYGGMAALLLLPLLGAGRPWRVRLAALGLVALPALAWVVYAMATIAAPSIAETYTPGPLWPGDPAAVFHGTDPAAQLQVLLVRPIRILSLTLRTIAGDPALAGQTVGILGWLDLPIQRPLRLFWYAAFACAVAADVLGPARPALRIGTLDTLLLGAAFAAVVIAIYQSQYLSWTRVGAPRIDGPQGRYWLPLLPMAAAALPRVPSARGWPPLLTIVPVLAAAASLATVPLLVVRAYYATTGG